MIRSMTASILVVVAILAAALALTVPAFAQEPAAAPRPAPACSGAGPDGVAPTTGFAALTCVNGTWVDHK